MLVKNAKYRINASSIQKQLGNLTETCPLEAFDLEAKPIECQYQRGAFLYDSFEMGSTIVTEWDLVCDKQYQVSSF